ncbi:hypothetical protein [Parasitella parasitica]|uniref:Uncharacterized protein n=1 Tax=Parasitella parasitica TaxID=35722 RepID=A0A0B7MUP4_9FUNG|nr:hypothetical protein [Parasitella parasitica]
MESKYINSAFFFASLRNSVRRVRNHISRQNTPEPGTPPPAVNEARAETAVRMSSQDQQVFAHYTADQDQVSSSSDAAESTNGNDLYNNEDKKDGNEENLNANLDAANHLANANDNSQATAASSSSAVTSSANVNEAHHKQPPSSADKEKYSLNNASKVACNTKAPAESPKEASNAFLGAVRTKKRSAVSMEEADFNAGASTSSSLPLPSKPRKKLRPSTVRQQPKGYSARSSGSWTLAGKIQPPVKSTGAGMRLPMPPESRRKLRQSNARQKPAVDTAVVAIDKKENTLPTRSLTEKRKRDRDDQGNEAEEEKPRKFLKADRKL